MVILTLRTPFNKELLRREMVRELCSDILLGTEDVKRVRNPNYIQFSSDQLGTDRRGTDDNSKALNAI
jgi:hypothetical protein